MKENIQIIVNLEVELTRPENGGYIRAPFILPPLLKELLESLKEYSPRFEIKSNLTNIHQVERRELAYVCTKCGAASGDGDGLVGGKCSK